MITLRVILIAAAAAYVLVWFGLVVFVLLQPDTKNDCMRKIPAILLAMWAFAIIAVSAVNKYP
jgi:preprotein translocase subunit SecG